ncbi:hypothetical protein C1I98_20760 [Spongiactinospora gelatinilytica]|uniref:Uncharacterized protein n=1 Tax=Spongiactinospora gelatinilytica TaxID=2666298 RepID=A0A2W2FWD7_9ACTN|nr:hypothetical protein C1I98_20760 [Spongiactinospora gelatinilytica]
MRAWRRPPPGAPRCPARPDGTSRPDGAPRSGTARRPAPGRTATARPRRWTPRPGAAPPPPG